MSINLNNLKGFQDNQEQITQNGLAMFGWESIDPWIQETCRLIGIQLNPVDTLEFQHTLANETTKFGTLGESRVYEAGWLGAQVDVPSLEGKTVISRNDCLIHSFLSCVSPTFRKINGSILTNSNSNKSPPKLNDSPRAVRNCIATIFRRLLMPSMFPDGTFGYDIFDNQVGDPLESILNSNTLEEYTGVKLCEQFGLNILFVQHGIPIPLTNVKYNPRNPYKLSPPNAMFYNLGSESTICIFGAPNHFQPVGLINGSPERFVLNGFDGDKWHRETFVSEIDCKYKEGNIVTYKDKQYWIMEVKYENGPPECTHLDLLEKVGDHAKTFPDKSNDRYGKGKPESRNWSPDFKRYWGKRNIPIGLIEAATNMPVANRATGTSAAASMTSTQEAVAASRKLSPEELRQKRITALTKEKGPVTRRRRRRNIKRRSTRRRY